MSRGDTGNVFMITVPKAEITESHLRNLLFFFPLQEHVLCLATYLASGKSKVSGLAVG